MKKVERAEIVDYETYEDERRALREHVMAEKSVRRVHVGEYLTFLFENHDTVRYQVQEMVRTERLVRESDIRHELDTYNELLGNDGELGCTLLIEIDDANQRPALLKGWRNLPEHIAVELEDGRQVKAHYDPRQIGDARLSSVQFLKFDTQARVPTAMVVDHPELKLRVELTDAQRQALSADLAAR